MNLSDKNAKSPGLPPGSLIYNGESPAEAEVKISRISYNPKDLHEEEEADLNDLIPKDKYVSWISVCGLHRPEIIQTIGDKFALHPLVLEDILNRRHRTKIEKYEDYFFLILKWPEIHDNKTFRTVNIALVIGANWVISFHEQGLPFFNEVRTRIRKSQGRIRKMGADYLGYSLIDTLVDHYFPLLEQIEDHVSQLDDDIARGEWKDQTFDDLSDLKRTALKLWKVLWSMRDLGNQIQRLESSLINKKTYVFFRDMQDHVTHLFELSDMVRIRLDDLTNLYLSRINMRMNEIMKTLTIIGSIFIPLTFIAGVYGMNFQHMPELGSPYGYPGVWLVMLGVVIGLLMFFRKRKWL